MVAVDGSPPSERALPVAIALARRSRASLHLVRVFDVARQVLSSRAGLAGIPDARAAMQGEACDVLEDLVERCRGAGVAADAALLEDEQPARALVEHARERRATLVVMSTHGRGFLGRAILGSVADAVVHESPAPVVLVPPHDEERSDDLALRARRIERLLVALDDEADAATAVERIARIPGVRDLETTLVRVVVPARVAGVTAPDALLAPDALPEHERAARAALDLVAAGLRERGIESRVRVLPASSPSAGILELAGDTDLVALSTRGHRGLRRLAMGSTTTEVVRQATLPVLLWTPPR